MKHNKFFNGNICGFQTNILLNAKGINFLLVSETTKKIYQNTIKYEYEGKSKEIQEMFTNLDQFFYYLCQYSEDKERISIKCNGNIVIGYNLKKRHLKNMRKIEIQTVQIQKTDKRSKKKIKQKQKSQEYNEYDQIDDHCEKQNDQNRKQIQSLRQLIQKMSQKDCKITNTHENNVKQISTKTISKHEQLIKVQRMMIIKLEQIILEMRAQMKSSKYLSDYNNYGTKIYVTVDRNNKYLNDQFSIDNNTITKIGTYGSYQILGKEVIPMKEKHYFIVFIEKINYSIFSIGIVNQNRRNYQNSHESKQCITYYGKNGAIWQGGKMRAAGPKVTDGSQMIVTIDMEKFIIKWYVNDKQIGSTLIGEHLHHERLVPYFQLNYTKNQITLNDSIL